MSAGDSIYRHLENIQREAYKDNPRAYRWKESPAELRLLDSVARLYSDSANAQNAVNSVVQLKLPTEFENPITYWILDDVSKQIEFELKKEAIPFVHPRLGTLPTASLNASSMSFPGGAELIIANSGIFGFCHELIKIAFKTIDFSVTKSKVQIGYGREIFDSIVNSTLTDSLPLLKRFSMALEDYANGRRIVGQAQPDTIQAVLGMRLVTCMEYFIIAHEYGHMILHHIPVGKYEPQLNFKLVSEDSPYVVNLHSWQQETEADIFGTLMLFSYIRSHPTLFDGVLQLAPYICFEFDKVAEESVYVMQNGESPDSLSGLLDNNPQALSIAMTYANLAGQKINSYFKKANYIVNFPAGQIDSLEYNPRESHPPNWVRAQIIQSLIRQNRITNEHQFDPLGIAFVENLQQLWDLLEGPWIKIINHDTANNSTDIKARAKMNLEVDSLKNTILNYVNGNTSGAPGSLIRFLDSIHRAEVPPPCEADYRLGIKLFDSKNYRKCIETLRRAETCGATASDLYFCLGSAYLDINENDTAIKYYTLAINKESPNVYYWNYGNRAIAYRRLGKNKLSMNDFKMAFMMTSYPDAQIYEERASLYLQMNEYDSAIKDYLQATEMAPQDIEYLADLYEAYAIKGDFQTVIQQRNNFVNRNPPKGYKLIFDFYEFVSRLQSGLPTQLIEAEINSLLNMNYDIIWYFDAFNKSLELGRVSGSNKSRILLLEKRVKQHLKNKL